MVATNIGVEVTTGLRSGPSNPGTPAGILQIAGLTERGPAAEPILVRSLAQYEQAFGGRTAYSANMLDTARLFFEEGGSQLLVSRAVGPSATNGSVILQDSLDADTVKVEAVHPGAYSTRLTISVAEDGPAKFSVTIKDNGEPVKVYRALSDVQELVVKSAGNGVVRFIDQGSETPDDGANPQVVDDKPLAAGSDDRGSVTVTQITDALAKAEDNAAGGAVAAPGYPASIVGSALLAYAAAHNMIALLATGADADAAEAITVADELAGAEFGEYGGLFYPHMVIPDGSGTRVVGPEGYVAAVRARAFKEVGFWQVPAGDRSVTRWASSAADGISVEKNNKLSASLVNGIVTSSGRVRLYNWTSLAADRENMALLSARDVLNNLTVQVRRALEPHVFAVLDGRGQLLSRVESAVEGVLSPVADAGGFYALVNGDEEIDPGYRIVVDSTNNTLETGAQNTVIVDMAVRLSPTAALIKAEIVKVALAAAL